MSDKVDGKLVNVCFSVEEIGVLVDALEHSCCHHWRDVAQLQMIGNLKSYLQYARAE